MNLKLLSESFVRDIKRNTRRKFLSDEKVSIVPGGLRAEKVLPDFVVANELFPIFIIAGAKV